MKRITEGEYDEFSDSLFALKTIAKNSNVFSIDLLSREGSRYITITTEQAVKKAERFSEKLHEILLEKGVIDQ